jgi:Sel1 repeat-containing protein
MGIVGICARLSVLTCIAALSVTAQPMRGDEGTVLEVGAKVSHNIPLSPKQQCRLGDSQDPGVAPTQETPKRSLAEILLSAIQTQRLAEKGDVDAQRKTGDWFSLVEKNYGLAAFWYRAAAEQVDPIAQVRLGALYGSDQGLPQDFMSAHMWLIWAPRVSHRGI